MVIRKVYRAYRQNGLSFVVSRILDKLVTALFSIRWVDNYCFKVSRGRLEPQMRREDGPGDVLDTAYNFEGIGNYKTIRPLHALPNAQALLNKVNDHEPSVIVEIGAGHGGSLYLWSRGVRTAELIISIDINPQTDARIFGAYRTESDVHVLQSNSHDKQTRETVENLLGERQIDVLYIDGDHSYEGVLSDFDMYSPLVKEGGLVILDDVDNTISAPEVPEAWEDIKQNHDTSTIKQSEKSSAQGIVHI